MRKYKTGESYEVRAYHGTTARFSSLDFSKARDGAHWFTTDADHATESGPYLLQAEIQMRSPLFIHQKDLEEAWDKEHPGGDQDERCLLPRDFVSAFVKQAKEQGHDGLVIEDFADRDAVIEACLVFSEASVTNLRPFEDEQ